MGMFEYKGDQLQQVLKALIYDLKAKTAAQMLPGLPAYILFMMIRSVSASLIALLFLTVDGASCQKLHIKNIRLTLVSKRCVYE